MCFMPRFYPPIMRLWHMAAILPDYLLILLKEKKNKKLNLSSGISFMDEPRGLSTWWHGKYFQPVTMNGYWQTTCIHQTL